MNEKLTLDQKNAIKARLQEYITKYGSQNKAAASLGVAAATLSAINKETYENISEEMWRKIAVQIGSITQSKEMELVNTSASKDLIFCMNETMENRGFVWAVSPAGSGKTATAKFISQAPNTYYILCDEDMRKGDFAREFARACGLRTTSGLTARAIILNVVQHLKERNGVLIIFDEADKLSDTVLHYFISIYNHLEDSVGQQMVGVQFISTDGHIKRRLAYGIQYKKKGYQELWSRLGSRFYEVDGNTAFDVNAICRANGVVNQKDINTVIKEADIADFDLRRVMRKINAILRKNQQKGV